MRPISIVCGTIYRWKEQIVNSRASGGWKRNSATNRTKPTRTRYATISTMLARLGEEALGEIAAHTMPGDDALSSMMSAADLTDIATRKGFEANTNNAIMLSDMANMPQPGQVEAWRLGKLFAQGIRDQERLDGQPISDSTLADFAEV